MGRRFQFSLKALFATVAIVASDLGLMLFAPAAIAEIALSVLVALAGATLTVGIVYAGEQGRAFYIGAMFPTALALYELWTHQLPLIADRYYPMVWPSTAAFTMPSVSASYPSERNVAIFGAAILASLCFGYICVALQWAFSHEK